VTDPAHDQSTGGGTPQAPDPTEAPASGVETAPDDAGPIIRLQDVTKRFGDLLVLDDLTLDFQRGKVTVIVGPSGTGKSVLLKHIVGLLEPDTGDVYFEHQHINQLGQAELVAVRRRIGFLFQMGAMFDSMSVYQNVCFPLVEHTSLDAKQREQRCRRVLRMVGLEDTIDKMPADLSGGQRKRVALARAIVLEPSAVLYDEPTTGLDPVTADLINELIIALNRHLGITSVVVTHDMASARKIADRIIMLHRGKIVADDKPEPFLDQDDPVVHRFVHGEAEDEDLQRIRSGFAAIENSDVHETLQTDKVEL